MASSSEKSKGLRNQSIARNTSRFPHVKPWAGLTGPTEEPVRHWRVWNIVNKTFEGGEWPDPQAAHEWATRQLPVHTFLSKPFEYWHVVECDEYGSIIEGQL